MAVWSFRRVFIHMLHMQSTPRGPSEWRPVAMETMVLGSWLCGEWGEGWVVAGVIEAVMSPLMVHQARMKKATTQQVMTSRASVHTCNVCVCVCGCVCVCVCVCVNWILVPWHFSNWTWGSLLIKVLNFGLFASQTSLGFYVRHAHTHSVSIIMLIQVEDGSHQACVTVVTPHW